MESVYQMALTYYPRQWTKAYIDALKSAGRLTEDEYDKIIGVATETAEEPATEG